MILDWFDAGADRHPDRKCIEDGSSTLRYSEVRSATHRIARAIHASIGERGHAGLYAPNCTEGLLAALGTFRAGTPYVPLNARDGVDDNAWFLDFAECELLFLHSTFAGHLTRLREMAPRLREFVCLDRDLPEMPSLSAWSAKHSDQPLELRRGPDDVAIIKSTGGTTGRPKGVLQTHRALEEMYRLILGCMPPRQPPVHLVVAPFTHAAGAIAYPLMKHGARQILMQQVDLGRILQLIESERVTYLFLPPTVIYRLLAHPQIRKHDYSSLEYFVYGAAPMSVDKLREAISVFGPVFAQCFGQAEIPLMCSYLSPQEHLVGNDPSGLRRLASAGRATDGTSIAIMDDDGKLLPTGERGEIVVRGKLVTPGYFRNPAASEEAMKFGWRHTGDIGYLDANGYLYIVDRKRDLIISGGFNVYPGEVEQVLWSHPAVQDCAVIGVPDPDWGEAVKAVLELRQGAQATEAELLAYCRERLGSIKTPKSVEFWKDLPRSSVGKVLKRDIRAKFWAGRERMV
jgi:acyl-CoA synthetase (AMP-forming)/AMP-acid ligase II